MFPAERKSGEPLLRKQSTRPLLTTTPHHPHKDKELATAPHPPKGRSLATAHRHIHKDKKLATAPHPPKGRSLATARRHIPKDKKLATALPHPPQRHKDWLPPRLRKGELPPPELVGLTQSPDSGSGGCWIQKKGGEGSFHKERLSALPLR